MVVDALWAPIHAVLSLAFSALPTVSLDLSSYIGTAAGVAGSWFSYGDAFLRTGDMATVFKIVLVAILNPLMIYVVANWTWRHIPQVGGFGTGAG